MVHGGSAHADSAICFRLEDYLELVDWSGRNVRADMAGVIGARTLPIRARLGIDNGEFPRHVLPPNAGTAISHPIPFSAAFGTPAQLMAIAARWGRKFLKG